MVAFAANLKIVPETPLRAQDHTYRFGAARYSNSSEQDNLRRQIYNELDQSESCSRAPFLRGVPGVVETGDGLAK